MSELEQKQRVWTIGDYSIVGDWFTQASQRCLDVVDVRDLRVLDVACGTGAVAIEAARRGAHVHGVDLTPAMLTVARQRAEAAGVNVVWHQGSFDDLSAFGGFDLVTSAFGVIFADDQAAVAKQLINAVKPGGVVSLTAWGPDGIFGDMSADFAQLIDGFAQEHRPCDWVVEETLTAIVADLPVEDVHIDAHVIGLPFASTRDALSQMKTLSGPWMMAFEMLAQQGLVEQANEIFLDRFERYASPSTDGVELQANYGLTTMRRKC